MGWLAFPQRADALTEENPLEALTVLGCLASGAFAGVVFSTIGAAGGILTSFGLITLFGVLEPNDVKPMTQLVVLAATLALLPGYLRRSALVLPLGLLLGAGGLIGAYVGSTMSSRYLSDMETFQPLFGALTLAIAVQIIWKLFHIRRGLKSPGPDLGSEGATTVSRTRMSFHELCFTCRETTYHIAPWSPLLAGAIISMTASIFGVGGGFLLVPYMTTLLGMPMHVIPATAEIAIFISLVVSVGNFLALGAHIQTGLLVPMGIGAIIDAIAGPEINKAMSNSSLQVIMALIVTGIGTKYVLF